MSIVAHKNLLLKLELCIFTTGLIALVMPILGVVFGRRCLAQPQTQKLIGKIIDCSTRELIPYARIRILIPDSDPGRQNQKTKDGTFSLEVAANSYHRVRVIKEGYEELNSDLYQLEGNVLCLKPRTDGVIIAGPRFATTIYFAYNATILDDKSRKQLDDFLNEQLAEDNTASFVIDNHQDPREEKLPRNARGKSIRLHLLDRGIPANRLITRNFYETCPASYDS